MDDGVLAEGLGKSFGQFRALDGLDLEVPAGTVGSVLGPNGAGKTTTIRILTTLMSADRGRAFVGGRDVMREPHAVRSVISLTGQYAAVDSDLTGRENLVMIAKLCRVSRPRARRRADELLEQFGLAAAGGRLVRTYSGGMRRRLDLAASLVLPPRVLFLDEPTTGLDPPSREELWAVVRNLRSTGTTIVLTTQYLEEADRLADHITVVDHGRAVARGTPEELKASVGGEILEIDAAPGDDAGRAARLLADRFGFGEKSVVAEAHRGWAQLRVPAGGLSTMDAARFLDSTDVAVYDIRRRRASLDDVFSALTGRPDDQRVGLPEVVRP